MVPLLRWGAEPALIDRPLVLLMLIVPWLFRGAFKKRAPPWPCSTSIVRPLGLVREPVTFNVALALLSPTTTLVNSMVPLLVKAGVLVRMPLEKFVCPWTRRMDPGPVVKAPSMRLLPLRAISVPLLPRGALIVLTLR